MANNEKELKQVSPWINLFREYEALFGNDPDISVIWEDESKTIKLYVENQVKADALTKLLPMSQIYGNITVNICVICANTSSINSLIMDAFDGNPIVEHIVTGDNPMTSDDVFVVFKPEVVQYKNDNLFDINGLRSTVYEEIARDIFDVPCTHFNTAKVN